MEPNYLSIMDKVHTLLGHYLSLNNNPSGEYELRDNGNLSRWTFNIAMPTVDELLSYDYQSLVAQNVISQNKLRLCENKIISLDQTSINGCSCTENGTLVYNTTTHKVMIYVNGAWKNIVFES